MTRFKRDASGIIVEFIGLPGSGKSTLAAELARNLGKHYGVEFPGRMEYRRRVLTLLEKIRLDVFHGPRLYAYRLRRLLFDMTRSNLSLTDSWRQSRFPSVLMERVKTRPRQFYVLDEWLLHRTIDESIRIYASDEAFSKAFAVPDTGFHRLVYVHVRVSRCVARVRVLEQENEFRWFANDEDAGAIDKVLATWELQLEKLRLEIDKRRIACIEVDGTVSVGINAEYLRNRLSEMRESTLPRELFRSNVQSP